MARCGKDGTFYSYPFHPTCVVNGILLKLLERSTKDMEIARLQIQFVWLLKDT